MTLKAYLPRSLFARALLILVLPTLLIQLITAFFFFERHVDTIERRMGYALAGEIAFFTQLLEDTPRGQWQRMGEQFSENTGVSVRFERSELGVGLVSQEYPDFQAQLAKLLQRPFTIRKLADSGEIELAVETEAGVVTFSSTIKRLESRTVFMFLLWMIGATVLFLFIAILFLANQIKPIARLAEAAESFGRGLDVPEFRPQGAREVRRAAKAFIIMRERLKRQVSTRTQMLAGISHDLRTPLTRLKLGLAMLGESKEIEELGGDVAQMEHMIREYLDFARGQGKDEPVATDLGALLGEVVEDYQRMGAPVSLGMVEPCNLELRARDIRRLLHNLIDNAVRHAPQCQLSLKFGPQQAEIFIDDNGPGIPAAQREEAFKPFSRLDPSRNLQTGGVGLGLAIARDIVYAHGGAIKLEESALGGLRVVVRLPV